MDSGLQAFLSLVRFPPLRSKVFPAFQLILRAERLSTLPSMLKGSVPQSHSNICFPYPRQPTL